MRETASASARWVESGGYDIDADAAVIAPNGNIGDVVFTAQMVIVPWLRVEALALLGTSEAFQVIAYNSMAEAFSVDRFDVPVGQSSPLDQVIAEESEFLDLLLNQRLEAADTQGMRQIELPDGRKEIYASLEVLDRRIAEVRSRIVWFSAAASGNVLPRSEFW